MSEPFAYEEYRKKKVKDKMDEKTKSRISFRTNLPKVSRAYNAFDGWWLYCCVVPEKEFCLFSSLFLATHLEVHVKIGPRLGAT